MSQIPRLHSSPTQPSDPKPTLKRKNAADSDDDDGNGIGYYGPRKVPALGTATSNKPAQPLRNVGTNGTGVTTRAKSAANGGANSKTTSMATKPPGAQGKGSNVNVPRPLTRPRQPNLSTANTTRARIRGTSAPPASTSSLTRPTRSNSTAATTVRGTTTARATLPSIDEKRFLELQHQVTTLQNQHLTLSSQFQNTATTSSNSIFSTASGITPDELASIQRKHRKEISDLECDLRKKEREARELNEDLRLCRSDLSREREENSSLKQTLSQHSTAHIAFDAQIMALKAQISTYQSQLSERDAQISELNLTSEGKDEEVKRLKEEAEQHERVRKMLHNKVQELKGNIRVFARVRPVLPSELASEDDSFEATPSVDDVEARISFPDKRDHKEIVVHSSSESAMGNERTETYNFSFDRVFEPTSSQEEVFDEISQLAQSCTDGYNVCIFAYGQTGSGKSFTMEGGPTAETQGMIPRAVDQVFRETEELRSKGWEYTIEGQFLEIYNETITDLLSTANSALSSSNSNLTTQPVKHEIKHDPKTHTTTVTSLTTHILTSSSQVRSLLALANSRRKTASTSMNERSSRSHSVFTLRLQGHNKGRGEKCRACLNLVDLAGSERFSVTKDGGEERMKETKAINKSLSALGDVIAALGEKGSAANAGQPNGEGHVPYRNSKLTYLLQYSLSGSSKTLMVLNLSPLAAHLNESLNSLRFATKVNNTTIGTAKKQTR